MYKRQGSVSVAALRYLVKVLGFENPGLTVCNLTGHGLNVPQVATDESETPGVIPVSYTHLDVYKRQATPDMSAIVARKRKVTATLQTGLEKTAAQLKVRVVRGDAEFVGAGLVRVASVDGFLEITGDRVILATGSSPLELPSLPVDHRLVLSSDDALELKTVPEHLVVVGGGVIGCELAFIYRAFGAKVTFTFAAVSYTHLKSAVCCSAK